MITGDIVKYVFWFFAGLTVLFGLFTMAVGLFAADVVGLFSGLLVTVLGPVLVRIYCELLVVIFKIHESLVAIKNK